MMLLAVSMMLFSWGCQDPPQPDPWKAEFTLDVVARKSEFFFVIKGTTNLPAGVVLQARVYAVSKVDDFRAGTCEDEEPLVWEGEEGQESYKVVQIRNGRFREIVYRYRREPYGPPAPDRSGRQLLRVDRPHRDEGDPLPR